MVIGPPIGNRLGIVLGLGLRPPIGIVLSLKKQIGIVLGLVIDPPIGIGIGPDVLIRGE